MTLVILARIRAALAITPLVAGFSIINLLFAESLCATEIDRHNLSNQLSVPPLNMPQSKAPLKSPQIPAVRAVSEKTTLQELRVHSIATDPLQSISQIVPILDLNGNVLFNEVQVENNHRAVEREWLILVNETELKLLNTLNIEIIKNKKYSTLGLQLIQFKVPKALDSWSELRKLLPQGLLERLGRNHIYEPQLSQTNQSTQPPPMSNSSSQANKIKAGCDSALKIGMIDTSINLQHPALIHQKIIQKIFVSEKVILPKGHGTVIAGILKANSNHVAGLLPNSQLFSASAFYSRNDYTQGASLMSIVDGLEWLSRNKVSVINMSLTGPENAILKNFINKIIEQGIMIVAAAGNQGPASPPAYPAAYPSVIAVTAVDDHHNIYRWANQGKHIDFSALGVNVKTLSANGKFSVESGTSLAVPIVAATFACEALLEESQSIYNKLKKRAIDLGLPGHDPIFGHGLLQSYID